jgi:hypothetical protein
MRNDLHSFDNSNHNNNATHTWKANVGHNQ